MGCQISKVSQDVEPEQEDRKVDLNAPAPPGDSRLPLSAKQRFKFNSSWKGISRQMGTTGMAMFLKLFEDNIEILSLFDKFKTLKTRDEQAQSLELAEHATVVMNSIDEGIRAMDNVDFFFDLLHQIGASHRKLPGFKSEYFWKIEEPFLEAVKLTLDERYSENIEQIYKITIRFIIETVIEGFEMAGDREVNDNVAENKKSQSGSQQCPMSENQKEVTSKMKSLKTTAENSSES